MARCLLFLEVCIIVSRVSWKADQDDDFTSQIARLDPQNPECSSPRIGHCSLNPGNPTADLDITLFPAACLR